MVSKYDLKELLGVSNTERQREVIGVILEEGGIRAAARKLNLSHGTITKMLKNLNLRLMELREEELPPTGVTATSTLYDADGNIKLQWVKEDVKSAALIEAIHSAIDAFKQSDVRAPLFATARPLSSNGLLAQYTIADFHLGMMAYADESGKEWSTDIAVERIIEVMDKMVDMVPQTEYAVINILGDFIHSDSMLPVTPKSRHVLDQDKRYPELIRIAVRVINYLVQKAKTKATTVSLLVAQGNHDPVGSLWLQELFDYYYEQDSSVEVIKSSSPFYCIEFGNTMLVYHHGDKIQFDKMAQHVPALFPEAWGRTKFRYAHMGDKHHKRVKDGYGIIVEQHQTLAPNDSYSSTHGYTSEKGANVIVYSKDSGELSRITIRP